MQNLPTMNLPMSGSGALADMGAGKSSGAGEWTQQFKSVFEDAVRAADKNGSVRGSGRGGESSVLGSRQDELTRQDFAAVREYLREQGVDPGKIQDLQDSFQSGGLTWDDLISKLQDLDQKFAARLSSMFKGGEDQALNFQLEDELTREEFSHLEKFLREQGVGADELESLKQKLETSGLTWEDLITRLDLFQGGSTQNLDSQQKQDLLGFFAQLGFNSDESQDLLNHVQSGRMDQVWEEMSRKLDELPEDARFSLDSRGLETLLLASGAGKENLDKYRGFAQGELDKSGMRNFLSMLQKDARENRPENLMQGLRDAVQGGKDQLSSDERMLARMVKAAQGEPKEATNDDKLRQLQFMKKEKAKDQGFKEAREGRQSGNSGRDSGEGRQSSSGSESSGENLELKNAGSQSQSSFQEGREQGQGRNESPWEKFLSRIRSDTASQEPRATGIASGIRESSEGLRQSGTQGAQREQLPQQVMDQLRSGVFQNLGQGKSKMTLQLEPPDLGRISVVLQVHNKEVQAMVRTTNQEVSQIINDNMSQLRTGLEQQGLRVSKIEVQTQLPEGQTGSWQGKEEHNRARERMRKAMEQARMKEMAKEEEKPLAPESQEIIYGKNLSQDGLSIFA